VPSDVKPIVPRIGVGSPSSPMEIGADQAPQLATELARLLREAGCEPIDLGAIGTADQAARAGRRLAEAHVDAVALTPACWWEDYLALDLLEECDVPVAFWSVPGMDTGSLCGTQQATYLLKQLGKPYACVYGEVQAGDSLDRTVSFLKAAALRKHLRQARIGIAGSNVPGMTEATVHQIALKKALGPRVVPVDMVGLLAKARAQDSMRAQEVWVRVKGAAGQVNVSDQDGLEAVGMYLAIKDVVEQEGLSGLAFGCYPDFMGCACLASSLLADEDVSMGCEGDVNGVVGMLMLMRLTGSPTHNTDWLDPLPDGTVVFSHCGSGSYSLAERQDHITLAPVRLVDQRVCSLFPARPGPVTLVSLTPWQAGYQMAVLEGEALSTEMVFPGNPLRVQFGSPIGEVIEWIHDQGIGHHWMAGYGHVAAGLHDLARIIGPDLHLLSL
jgi:L-fucose isomerase-like protein